MREGSHTVWGKTNCCLGICVHVCVHLCVFACLSSCQHKHFSEYLMHVFICVCLSVCDNRMSAKTEELMRPFCHQEWNEEGAHSSVGIMSVCNHDCHVSNLCLCICRSAEYQNGCSNSSSGQSTIRSFAKHYIEIGLFKQPIHHHSEKMLSASSYHN